MKKTIYSILALIFFLTSITDANAWSLKRYKVCNNTGSAASYFQATFSGTGGNLAAKIIVNPCGYSPAISIASGNTAVFFWGTNCVAPNACVTFDVLTQNGPLVYVSGYWGSTTTQNLGTITLNVDMFQVPLFFINTNCFLGTGNQFKAVNPFYQNGPDSFFDVFMNVAFCQPMPTTGSSVLNGNLVITGNSSWGQFAVTAPAAINVTYDHMEGDTKFYDTELMGLTISGGGLAPNIMLRESPTLASTGQTKVTDIGGGQFAIDSFFDVFTEVSVDGGANWTPSQANASHIGFESPVENIPTLSQWGLIILGIMLLMLGAFYIMRRKRILSV